MNILYVVHQFFPEYYTGTEKIVLNLASAMQRAGHSAHVLTYSFYPVSEYDSMDGSIAVRNLSFQGVPITAIRTVEQPPDIHFSLRQADLKRYARKFFEERQPDVVHVGHAMRVGELIVEAHRLGIPVVMTLTDFFMVCPKYNLIRSDDGICSGPEGGKSCAAYCPEFDDEKIRSRLSDAETLLGSAAALTALSSFSAQLINAEFTDLEIEIVEPGLRLDWNSGSVESERDNRRLVFGYAGSLNHHKGVHTLIDAFRELGGEHRLLIYGSGTDERYVSKLNAQASPDPRIEFRGVYEQGDIGNVFQEMDALVIPSLWYETYCLVMHEAYAFGVPVLASRLGVMKEFIQDRVDGFLFEPGSVADLGDLLTRLTQNSELLASARQHGLERPVRSVDQEAYDFERIYYSVC